MEAKTQHTELIFIEFALVYGPGYVVEVRNARIVEPHPGPLRPFRPPECRDPELMERIFAMAFQQLGLRSELIPRWDGMRSDPVDGVTHCIAWGPTE